MKKINVFIVDDSAVVRQVLRQVLGRISTINIVGFASDPLFAMDKMSKRWPDVIILDIEMPRMDGITFLKKIMAFRPTPVVICSSLAEAGASTTLQALSAGAVSIVTKPKVGLKSFLQDAADDIVRAIKAAARANMSNVSFDSRSHLFNQHEEATKYASHCTLSDSTEKVVVIGSSTGGTQALELLLSRLPVTMPGIVVVQHMPAQFTASLAQRLNSICELTVKEAEGKQRLLPGMVLIAPGGRHLTVKRSGAQFHVEVIDGPVVNHHRPSVDVLFRSVAKCAGQNAIGIILTGMGGDGARGMKEMHDAGAYTLAQDEKSCVVFGMPKEAIGLGAVEAVLPLQKMAEHLVRRICADGNR